jgi:hypothetical protein
MLDRPILAQPGDASEEAGTEPHCAETAPGNEVIMTELGSTVVKLELEADKAARHKQALSNAMLVVCAVAEEARRDGFYVEFGLGMDQFGRYVINPPATILKRY